MPNIKVMDMTGNEVSNIELSDAIFGITPNVPAMHTMVVNYLANQRQGTQSTLTLAEIELMTGRTHQIRAHMAYIGCPLLGDGKYGINRVNRSYNIKTQALYSYKLKFDFTTDSGILSYLNGREFTAENVWFADKFVK